MRYPIFLKSLFLAVVLVFTGTGIAQKTDPDIEALLSKMTLAEKTGQMSQHNSWGATIPPYLAKAIKDGHVGSVLNEVNPEKINDMQRIAVEESRLGIPIIIGRDVIHGFRTIFPIPLGQAATWNPELIEEGTAVAALEARSVGVHWTFAPMMDIARDSRWGRIAESYGEDPYLAEQMAAAMVRGFQGEDMGSGMNLVACAKHYVGYGAAEGGRDYNTTYIPQSLLRNVYLRPFKAAVDAGVGTLMTAFNSLNGIPATAHYPTIRNLLLSEWGFKGYLVSDWDSVKEMIIHGYARDEAHAAEMSINAGVHMEMASSTFRDNAEQLLEEGKIRIEEIDDAVRRILLIKKKAGLFENPYTDLTAASPILSEDKLEAARKTAVESFVLLKNENDALPLNPDKIKRLALVGPLVDAPHDQLGTWSFDGKAEDTITPKTAITRAYGDKFDIVVEAGLTFSRDRRPEGIDKALKAVKDADAIVAFIGEEAVISGESHSMADLDLVGLQKEFVAALEKTGKPLVLVVMAGRPLTQRDELAAADAMLYAWHPGTMGGPAIADVLFGKENPSGKLPSTFPKVVGQEPIYYNHMNTGRPSSEDQYTSLYELPVNAAQSSPGYKSHYLDEGFGPWLPFGYGLSYTTFEYDDLKLSSETMSTDGEITVSVTVENTGDVAGMEVVQLYTRDLVGSIVRPVRELKGFAKISLEPDEEKMVSFTLKASDLGFYNYDDKFVIEPGDFQLWVGPNSVDGLTASFKIE